MCHLNTMIEEHLEKDKKIHIYSHLQKNCEIIDRASSYFRLQIKKAMHINWKKTELNKQVKHVSITVSIWVYCSITVSLSSHFLLSFFSVSLCAYQVSHFNHLPFNI